MKKRLLAASAAIILSLSACGGAKVKLDPKNPIPIVVWHYYNGAQKTAFDQLVAEFNDTTGAKEGVIVEAVNQGGVSQLIESVIASANNKVGTEPIPNIFAGYADTAWQIDKLGLVIELTPYLTQEELNKFMPSYVESGRLGDNNALKIFPVVQSSEVLMVNQTDWDKFASATGANISSLQTMEGIVKTAAAYYDWTDGLTPDIKEDGKAFFGRDAFANYMIIGSKQLGQEIFSVDGSKVTFKTDEKIMRKLWDNYYTPYINGYFTANARFRSDDTKTGDIIALVGSTSSASYFPKQVILNDNTSYPIDCTVMPAPRFEDGEPWAVQQGAGMVVTKTTPEEEYASILFLKWFTQEDRNVKFATMSGYMPVNQSSLDMDVLTAAMQESTDPSFYDVLQKNFAAELETIDTCEFYTNKAFDGGTEARTVLENSLTEKAAADRKTVLEKMAQGMSRKQAVDSLDTEENFKLWLESLRKELDATQQGGG